VSNNGGQGGPLVGYSVPDTRTVGLLCAVDRIDFNIDVPEGEY
jgi:hypothetical protein